jgi:hypothetical protein
MNTGTWRIGTGTALPIAAVLLALCAVGASAADEPAAHAAPAVPSKPLDLRPPDVTKVLTSQQLAALLEKLEDENIEEVEVEGVRVRPQSFTPRVWPAIAAPFWALLHPTQAWRIFAPIPPDQARYIDNQKPDTEGYLEPLGVPPGDPFKQ